MLNEAGSQKLVKYDVGLFGEYGVDAVRPGKDGGADGGDGNRKRNKGARAKVSLRRGKNIGELAEDVTQGRDDWWRPTRAVKVERDVTQVEGELIRETEEACPLVVAQAFEEFGARCFQHRRDVGRR